MIIKNLFSEGFTNINTFHNKNVYQNIQKYEQLYKQDNFNNFISKNHETISNTYNVNDTMVNVSNNVSKYTSNFLNFNDTLNYKTNINNVVKTSIFNINDDHLYNFQKNITNTIVNTFPKY